MTVKTKKLKRERVIRVRTSFDKKNSGMTKEIYRAIIGCMRLPFVGFINFCFFITRSPKMIATAYVLWAAIGSGVAFIFYDEKIGLLSTYLLLGMTLGGFVGFCLSLWKNARKMKYGTPYF